MTHSKVGMTLCLINLDKMTLRFMSLGIMPLIMIILDIATFNIMILGTTTQHNNTPLKAFGKRRMTFYKMPLGIMPVSIMVFRITSLCIMTLCITTL
jgi:hypothetical protein